MYSSGNAFPKHTWMLFGSVLVTLSCASSATVSPAGAVNPATDAPNKVERCLRWKHDELRGYEDPALTITDPYSVISVDNALKAQLQRDADLERMTLFMASATGIPIDAARKAIFPWVMLFCSAALPENEVPMAIEMADMALRLAPTSPFLLQLNGAVRGFFLRPDRTPMIYLTDLPPGFLDVIRTTDSPGPSALTAAWIGSWTPEAGRRLLVELARETMPDHFMTCLLDADVMDPLNPNRIDRYIDLLNRSPPDDLRVFVAQRLFLAAGEGRAIARAISLFDSWPESLRNAVANGRTFVERGSIDGLTFNFTVEDIRHEIAAAHAFVGRRDIALQFWNATPNRTEEPWNVAFRQHLLSGGHRNDLFEIAESFIRGGRVGHRVWSGLIDAALVRAGYLVNQTRITAPLRAALRAAEGRARELPTWRTYFLRDSDIARDAVDTAVVDCMVFDSAKRRALVMVQIDGGNDLYRVERKSGGWKVSWLTSWRS